MSLQKRIRRTIIDLGDGSTDLVTTFIFQNLGAAEAKVPNVEFTLTDVEAINGFEIYENRGWNPSCDRYDTPGKISILVFPTKEVLEANSALVLAMRTRRLGCISVDGFERRFSDPMLNLDSDPSIDFKTTVIFKASIGRREVHAPNGVVTSRTATFHFIGNGITKCEATSRLAKTSSSPKQIDDALAELHQSYARLTSNQWVDFEEYSRLFPSRPVNTFPLEEPLLNQMRWIESEIEFCEAERNRRINDTKPVHVGDEREFSELIGSQIERLGFSAKNIPCNAGDVIESLSRYLLEQRKHPHKWSNRVNETEFNQNLKTFLSGRGQLETEVSSAKGRIDFLLGETPVELKCKSLGPKLGIESNLQQAAAYATSRNRSLACLVILDTSKPSTKEHFPPPIEDTSVLPVNNAGATSKTIVVVFRIRGAQTSPSKLRPGTKKAVRGRSLKKRATVTKTSSI